MTRAPGNVKTVASCGRVFPEPVGTPNEKILVIQTSQGGENINLRTRVVCPLLGPWRQLGEETSFWERCDEEQHFLTTRKL